MLRLQYVNNVPTFAFDVSSTATLVGPTATHVNEWHHWLVSCAWSGTSWTRSLYLDGALLSSDSGLTQSLAGASNAMRIAMRYSSSTAGQDFFAGQVDEVRLYRTVAFTATQAASAANNIFTAQTGLWGWLPFTTPANALFFSNTAAPTTTADASGVQPAASFFPATLGSAPGMPMWSNSAVNPICLPAATKVTISGSACGGVNSLYTFTVAAVDANGDVVTEFAGGSISVSYGTATNVAWSGMGSTANPASAAFVNGYATFSLVSSAAQSITLSTSDTVPVFASTPVSSMSVSFSNSRRFVFQTINPVRSGSAATVSVGLAAACGSSLVFGVTTTVTVASTSTGLSGLGVLTIDSSTGLGSLPITSFTARTVTLTLVDSASTGYSVSSTTTATWAGSAVSFTLYPTPTASVTVLSQFQLYVAVADSLGGVTTDSTGKAKIGITATGSSSAPGSFIYLNGDIGTTNITCTTAPVSLVLATYMAQTVTLSYVSWNSNYTIVGSNMAGGTSTTFTFTAGPFSTFALSSVYKELSTDKNTYKVA